MDLEKIIFCKPNIRNDYSGKQFNKFNIISPVGKLAKKCNETVYLCECECGKFVFYTTTEFKKNISCGCSKSDHIIKRNLKHGMY